MAKMMSLSTLLEFYSTWTVLTGKELQDGRDNLNKSGPDSERCVDGQKYQEISGLY